jgi:hypothetical protein
VAWVQTDALTQFRRLLGDTDTDKYTFKTQLLPTPDGVGTIFHTGDTRLVAGTLRVYLNGALVDEGDYDADLQTGTVDLDEAPAAESVLLASYNFSWFQDDQLIAFLLTAANTIGMETEEDTTLPVGLRPALLHFACYFAYMSKAAETADSIIASAAGYTVDHSKSFPNWKRMAENAKDSAKSAIDFYNENILSIGGPGIAIVSYRLPNYVPTS